MRQAAAGNSPLLYGIRTDTAAFERSGGEEDLRAYQWLSPHHADNNLLRRIAREYLRLAAALFARLPLAHRLPGRRAATLGEIKHGPGSHY